MAEHPNARIAHEMIEAMDRQDFEGAMSHIADEVRWHYIGGSEPIVGKRAMAEGMSARDWTIRVETHDVLATDDHVVVLVRAHAERDGRTLDYDTAEIMHVEDGKIAERWAFSDDTARITEFFA